MSTGFVVAAFYRFVHLHNYYDMRPEILGFCNNRGIKGTVILAEQGINATISGSRSDIHGFFEFLNLDSRLAGIQYQESYSNVSPFSKMKVRLKHEVVRLGIEGFDCSTRGEYVDPCVWNELISKPGVHVVDTRNDYEIKLGRFKRAINPCTTSFREFPDWAREWANGKEKDECIAMYCTGGIRCEKSTAFIKSLGFKNVYHLKGGILNYLKTVHENDSLWEGECFVFDDRVAVDHSVAPSNNIRCVRCSGKVEESDLRSVTKGYVTCTACKSNSSL